MNFISYEDFKKTSLYNQFILDNPDVGYLKIQAFTAYGAIPISDVDVIVTKNIGDYKVIFYQGKTDADGIISDIMLPAPKTVTANDVEPSYTLYDLTCVSYGYETIKNYSIGMFGDVRVLQYVKMRQEYSDD